MSIPPDAQDSLEELVGLFENEPCGHVVTSLDGLFLRANAAFLAMTGFERDEIVAKKRFGELLTAGGRIYLETHLRPLLLMQGYLREIALEVVCADGTRLPILINSVVRPDAAGAAASFQTVVFDATERWGYEQELLTANRRIERLQRVTATFASVLDAQQIARSAIEELVDGVKADHGVLALLSTDGENVVVGDVIADASSDPAEWHGLRVGEVGRLDAVLRSGQPDFLEGDDQGERGVPALGPPGASMSRSAIFPLAIGPVATGILCIASAGLSEFKADERVFLASFARLCAQALERARLHEASELAGRRARFLSLLGRELDEKIGFDERAQLLVDLLVPDFADFATVEIAARGQRPVAARHRDPALLDSLVELREHARVDDALPPSLARARVPGELQILTDVPGDLDAASEQDADRLALIRRLSPRSCLGLPLRARGDAVGSLILALGQSGRRYLPGEVPFFVDVADRAGLALENARLLEHERGVAHQLQMSLLPRSLPIDPRLEISARYRPSAELMDIGGDWYDAFPLPGDRVGFVVGDVVGHNIDAAIVMGQMRTALRAFAVDGGGPASTIGRLSRFAVSVPGASCTTLVYAELDLGSHLLTYACSGHLPPIVLDAGRPPAMLWEGRSPPLGAAPEADVAEATFQLGAGSSVLLVTDGLIERQGTGIDASLQDLLDRLAGYDTTPERFLDDLIASLFSEQEQADDICMLGVSLLHTRAGDDGNAPSRVAGPPATAASVGRR